MITHLSQKKKHDIVVACPVMKNNKNISMIVRTAACFGASEVIITGNNKANKHISRECDIPVTYKNSLSPVIKQYSSIGYRIVALEQGERTQSLYDYTVPLCPILVTMGSEARGMDSDILAASHEVVEIPLCGNPYSLNVAMSVSIFLHEITKQLHSIGHMNLEGSAL